MIPQPLSHLFFVSSHSPLASTTEFFPKQIMGPAMGQTLWTHPYNYNFTHCTKFVCVSVSPARGFPGGSVERIHQPVQKILEMWVQFLGQRDPLEGKIATCSRVLTRKIPWTEEPGELQSRGLRRVRHNRVT